MSDVSMFVTSSASEVATAGTFSGSGACFTFCFLDVGSFGALSLLFERFATPPSHRTWAKDPCWHEAAGGEAGASGLFDLLARHVLTNQQNPYLVLASPTTFLLEKLLSGEHFSPWTGCRSVLCEASSHFTNYYLGFRGFPITSQRNVLTRLLYR